MKRPSDPACGPRKQGLSSGTSSRVVCGDFFLAVFRQRISAGHWEAKHQPGFLGKVFSPLLAFWELLWTECRFIPNAMAARRFLRTPVVGSLNQLRAELLLRYSAQHYWVWTHSMAEFAGEGAENEDERCEKWIECKERPPSFFSKVCNCFGTSPSVPSLLVYKLPTAIRGAMEETKKSHMTPSITKPNMDPPRVLFLSFPGLCGLFLAIPLVQSSPRAPRCAPAAARSTRCSSPPRETVTKP